MEVRKLKNSKGEILTTKEGIELEELRFEPGDEFIPVFNKVLEKTNEGVEVVKNGKKTKQNITNYSLKCRVRDRNKQQVTHNNSEEVFVTLTPTQAKSLMKKVEEGIELNQNLFVAYKYESKDYGSQVGLGLKKANKAAKTFNDFDEKGELMNKKPDNTATSAKPNATPANDIEIETIR